MNWSWVIPEFVAGVYNLYPFIPKSIRSDEFALAFFCILNGQVNYAGAAGTTIDYLNKYSSNQYNQYMITQQEILALFSDSQNVYGDKVYKFQIKKTSPAVIDLYRGSSTNFSYTNYGSSLFNRYTTESVSFVYLYYDRLMQSPKTSVIAGLQSLRSPLIFSQKSTGNQATYATCNTNLQLLNDLSLMWHSSGKVSQPHLYVQNYDCAGIKPYRLDGVLSEYPYASKLLNEQNLLSQYKNIENPGWDVNLIQVQRYWLNSYLRYKVEIDSKINLLKLKNSTALVDYENDLNTKLENLKNELNRQKIQFDDSFRSQRNTILRDAILLQK